MAIDSSNSLFVGDWTGIRKISPDRTTVTTIVGGLQSSFQDGVGPSALFSSIAGIAISTSGVMAVADTNAHRIRKIVNESIVTTWIGDGSQTDLDGTISSATVWNPRAVAFDRFGNLYFAGTAAAMVRKASFSTGMVTTVAGSAIVGALDGFGEARFQNIMDLIVDHDGVVFVNDAFSIRKLLPSGLVTTLTSNLASFVGMTFDLQGNLLVCGDNQIFKVFVLDGEFEHVTGGLSEGYENGPLSTAQLLTPEGIVVDKTGVVIFSEPNAYSLRRFELTGMLCFAKNRFYTFLIV